MTSAAPLLATADDLLTDQVQRLAAAAGVGLDLARDPTAAMRAWAAAPLVLLGPDLAAELADCAPARRPAVFVLAPPPIPDLLFRIAVQVGAENLADLPGSDAWLVDLLTDTGDGATEPGMTVGVLGGSGGVGASVFATALAQTLSAVGPTLLVDADPLGAGVDRILGAEAAAGVRWDALTSVTGRLGARALRDSLPRVGDLSVLAWPADRAGSLQPFALREVLSAGARGHHHVVLDLPRHLDNLGEETLSRCQALVLVTTDRVGAVSAAGRVAGRLRDQVGVTRLVVRETGGVGAADVARVLRLPLATRMGSQRGLDEAIDLGAGPLRHARGQLARGVRALAAELGR